MTDEAIERRGDDADWYRWRRSFLYRGGAERENRPQPWSDRAGGRACRERLFRQLGLCPVFARRSSWARRFPMAVCSPASTGAPRGCRGVGAPGGLPRKEMEIGVGRGAAESKKTGYFRKENRQEQRRIQTLTALSDSAEGRTQASRAATYSPASRSSSSPSFASS